MRRYQSILLIMFLVCLAGYGFAAEALKIEAATQANFPTRVLGSIAAIGDSITMAFDAAYSEFGSCLYMDNPEYGFCTNTTSNSVVSVAERAIAYKGSAVAVANFGSDGAKMTTGYDQALEVKTWALTQATPRLITVFLGHNDICGGEEEKYNTSCDRASQDPNNYCRTSTFYYEQDVRQMLDVLITIPGSQIAIIHPIRVSQLCNFADEKVVDESWLTLRCKDLWVIPNLVGEDAVCPSMTSCSTERVADAYTTWVSYRDIVNRVVEEYNLYSDGQTIPYNSTYNTGNVVRAGSVYLQTSDAIGNLKFVKSGDDLPVSVCECFHPSKYGQSLLANSLWDGLTCSAATPCCNDNIEGDSDYNKGLCNNYTTSGSTKGLWNIGEDKILTVTKEGSGAGMVTSNPGGISCGSDCSEPYTPETVVTLTATANAGSVFTSWNGCDTTNGNTCTVTMTTNKSIFVRFAPSLYASFTGTGVYQYDGSTWTQVTPYNPTAMTAAGSLLYASFGNGVWQYNGSTWSQLTPYSPEAMVAAGSLLYGKYPNGIWQYNGSTWSQLTPYSPEAMVAAGSLLYGKYDNGIWQYNGSTWTQVTPYSPAAMVAGGSLLYGKYPNGIWQYDGSTWSQLTPYSPTTMVATGSLLYAIYDNGIWLYNGSSWSQATPNIPEGMVATGSLLYGDYGPSGIWQYDGSIWTQITPSDPASMAGN